MEKLLTGNEWNWRLGRTILAVVLAVLLLPLLPLLRAIDRLERWLDEES